ncbi:cytochrome P450 monooxygenase pc-3 [Gymnopilus junonius]|uniref:Cytochrome P450 monooxygenase pc-3 n=1 Tax=Gymnopilus junonius TaxID=109634 RepID=A0A9P5NBG1_GYMJU|nr:cytochrome P450 monooxygenase pc-3 [Gymnopilus junonius]
MEIPPGPKYVLQLLPFFLLPSVIAFGLIRFSAVYLVVIVPNWLAILSIILARPLLIIFQCYYARHVDKNAAAVHNAFIIPHIEEKRPAFAGLSIIRTLVNDFKTGYPGDRLLQWKEKYGNVFQLRLPSDNWIVTFEPDHVKSILVTQFDSFDKGEIMFSQFVSLLGTGVFNSDGDMWKFHQTMTRPFFTRERITDFDNFDMHMYRALDLAKHRLAEGHAIDFQDLVSHFTFDSGTQFLFGHDVESLSAGLPYSPCSEIPNSAEFVNHPSNVFVNAFLEGQSITAFRTRMGPNWPLSEFWSDKVKSLRKIMDGFMEPLMIEALKNTAATEKADLGGTDESSGTLLSHLVKHTQDVSVLKDELINLLVAGRDTTASLLSYAFYMLTQYPNIAQRLHQEVLDKIGATKRPTYDDIRDTKYLRAFLNEVLRLYPPVPFDSRSSCKETVWTSKTPGSKPYYIPNNTRILYSIFHMHRRTDLWGPDALEFDPDRFLDERLHKYLTPNPYIFCPFNAGPRICLGQQFAYQESSFFLIRLLQQFTNFRMVPEAQPEEFKPPASWKDCGNRKALEKICPGIHLTMYIKGGLWVRMDELRAGPN